MSDTFLLNMPISRPDVVEWLRGIPEERLSPAVENALAAGNLTLSLLQASTGEESMQRFFRPVLGPMEHLTETIEGILRATQKSQRLGELGEEVVAEQLKSAFPTDSFEIVSTREHQADIHADFNIGGTLSKALIEVKLHNGDVPTKEIEKFRSDMEKTGFRFGLMVSLTSRLTGISAPFHLENSAGYLAVFVPNAGLDGFRLLSATAMLKAIVLHQSRRAEIVPTGAIEQAWERLNGELEELRDISNDVHELRDALQSSHQNLSVVFGKLTEKAISAECRLHYALDRITNRLAEEFTSLPRTTKLSLVTPSGRDEVLGFLNDLRKGKDGRLKAFEALFDLSKRLELKVRLNEGHWQILRDGVVVAWTDGTKTRLDACVPVDFAESPEILLDMRLEKPKADHIIISGAAPERLMDRLTRRLGSGTHLRAT